MTAPGPPRRYRPVTLWFLGIVAAVIALAILGRWLEREFR